MRVPYLYINVQNTYIHAYVYTTPSLPVPPILGRTRMCGVGGPDLLSPFFTAFPFSFLQNSGKPLSTSTYKAITICTRNCPHVLFHLAKGGPKNSESEWIRQTLTFKGFPKDLLNKKEGIYYWNNLNYKKLKDQCNSTSKKIRFTC